MIVILILLSLLLSFLTIISLDNHIFAQYTGGAQSAPGTLEEQLKLAQLMLQEAPSEIEKYYESKQFPLSSYITTIPSKFNNSQTYENKDLGFTIKYPSNEGWNLIYFKNDKNLTDNNVIKKFTIEINNRGKNSAINLISVASSSDTSTVTSKLLNLEGVDVVYEITGQYDIAAIISASEISEINSYIDEVRKIEGVSDTNTVIILKTLKNT